MVVPEERDGKSEIANEMLRDSSKPADNLSSRKGGGRDKPIQRKVRNLIEAAIRKLFVYLPVQ